MKKKCICSEILLGYEGKRHICSCPNFIDCKDDMHKQNVNNFGYCASCRDEEPTEQLLKDLKKSEASKVIRFKTYKETFDYLDKKIELDGLVTLLKTKKGVLKAKVFEGK